MALEGTLRDFSLADIFQLIGLQRKTGVLTLRGSEDVVTISFLDGRVVGSDSVNKRLEDRIGQVLIKRGVVSSGELESMLRTQMETLERLGHILIRHQIISREQLKSAMEQQVLQIIFRVFRWQDGEYHFSQETSIDFDADLVTPLSAESILMEGARMLDEWPIIEKRIPHRGIVFVPTPAARQIQVSLDSDMEEIDSFDLDLEPVSTQPLTGKQVRISQQEFDILRLANGLDTVEDIIRKSPNSDFDTCKALYTLLTRSIIREATRDELARASQQLAAVASVAHSPTRLPWLALALVPFLGLSMLLAPRNPLNPLFGPRETPLSRIQSAISRARMMGVWNALNSRYQLAGAFPDSLSELIQENLLKPDQAIDPWGHPYRYVFREQSILLTGSTPSGIPDPNLIISVHLGIQSEDRNTAPGVALITP